MGSNISASCCINSINFFKAQSSCSHGDFRLSDTKKSSENEGNVEICWNCEWLPVHYSSLISSSRVPGLICQQLGFSAKGILYLSVLKLHDFINRLLVTLVGFICHYML